MTMTLDQIRLKQNPILTKILLGLGQGTYIAESLFPRLPQALSKVTVPKIGNERFKKYDTRRAPGAATKRINIKYDGQTYTVEQHSIEVPLPRELIREADAARNTMNVGANVDISRIAMVTANDVLALGYEIEVALLATDLGTYPAGHKEALTSTAKWSAETGTPVTDIRAAASVIRKATGKRPNKLTLSQEAMDVLVINKEVRSYLPNTQTGPATIEQLKTILKVEEILEGDAIWVDDEDKTQDVWGNNAILAYVPKIGGNGAEISLAEPAFGWTNVIEGHPFAEQPYYDTGTKSYVYGATYERLPNVVTPEAGFLFANVK